MYVIWTEEQQHDAAKLQFKMSIWDKHSDKLQIYVVVSSVEWATRQSFSHFIKSQAQYELYMVKTVLSSCFESQREKVWPL